MKGKILESVSQLFLNYGVRSVSMDDIAHELGISKKTIYQNFIDKDDLVKQTTALVLKDRQSEFDAIEESAENSIEEQVMISKCIRKEFTEMNPSLMFDIQKYHPEAWDLYLLYEQDVIEESVRRNLKRGIKEGFFRPGINVDIMARLRIQQIQLSFSDKVFPKKEYDLKEVQIQLFDHFVYGLFTEEGLTLYKKYLQDS
jgi:AcrR family transcriptional regulator